MPSAGPLPHVLQLLLASHQLTAALATAPADQRQWLGQAVAAPDTSDGGGVD